MGEDQVFEGEVVTRGRPRGRDGRSQGTWAYHEDFIRKVVTDWAVKRRPMGEIAEEYGISSATVHRWCRDSAEARLARARQPDVVAIREQLADELEVVSQEAWEVHRQALDPRTRLDALGRVESTVRARALLYGANAPVRVNAEVTLTAVTEAEKELEELIREAKVRQTIFEAAVIAAASDDPDL